MSADRSRQALIDTNILILRDWIDPAHLSAIAPPGPGSDCRPA